MCSFIRHIKLISNKNCSPISYNGSSTAHLIQYKIKFETIRCATSPAAYIF